ncbi:TetR family transcriptional regulator [Dactylosporangium sp. NBC_01737]|uniref:TetR/AcrR family transcriptional regulator n=1 Tax=Dactylosporangium sp. NBC_01737 TaxID=2975959 RepID=UPI002E10D7AA|nr:TetR family transcriptional regulator [Dactylosporangium sp. NBC_01737]
MTTQTGPRRRDAAGTRRLLLEAARRRFAADGYTAATVRDIATDAGVNVALINRYFTSKEGLFEACLAGVGDELGREASEDVTLERIPHDIAARLAGPHAAQYRNQLLLLLRSSGDERAERIRADILHTFADRLATAAGWRPGDTDAEGRMLRAQITLASAIGIALVRSSTAMEPLASAGQEDLAGPLRDMFTALLRP